jgi:hypothetical protein
LLEKIEEMKRYTIVTFLLLFMLPTLGVTEEVCNKLLNQLVLLDDDIAQLVKNSSTHPNYPMAQSMLVRQKNLLEKYFEKSIDDWDPKKLHDLNKLLDATENITHDAKNLLNEAPIKYVNPGHHDVTSPNFRGGGDKTSHLPKDHEALWRDAIPYQARKGGKVTRSTTFWVCNAAGAYHRFQGAVEGGKLLFHWNGDSVQKGRTIRLRDIPKDVRLYFKARNSNCK